MYEKGQASTKLNSLFQESKYRLAAIYGLYSEEYKFKTSLFFLHSPHTNKVRVSSGDLGIVHNLFTQTIDKDLKYRNLHPINWFDFDFRHFIYTLEQESHISLGSS